MIKDMQTNNTSVNSLTTLKQYWRTASNFPRDMTLAGLLPVANVLLGVVVPLFASKILASLVTDREDIWANFMWLIAIVILGLVLNLVGIRSSMVVQAKVMHQLYKDMVRQLMQRSVGFYNNQISGKLVSDALDYGQSFSMIFTAGFIGIFGFLSTLVVGLLIIFINSLWLGVGTTIFIVIMSIWTFRESRKRMNIRLERLKLSKILTSHLSDTLVNAITVKTFARETDELERGTQHSENLREVRERDWQRTVTSETYRMGALMFAQVALIGGLIILSKDDPSLLATGIFAFTYTLGLLNRFFTVNTMIRQLDDSLLQALPMTELLEQPIEITDVAHAKQLTVPRGEITFDNVRFHYADSTSDETVFKNLNLSIRAGEKVGLVGHSGGGKTTLTRLLLRFDDITGGSISVDGQDITEVTQTSLREQIAYVPQEPLLFHRTITENISYGKDNASAEEIKKASQKAKAHEFIKALPKAYDTVVGERGVKLSGGQRQRVAIARAILKNAPILVLDEATSALDSESEKAIQDALWELMKGKTAIVIAHRLSTIQHMDRIVVLDSGKIVEQGSHAELLKQNGTYARLWKHQSGGFIQE